MSILTNYKSIIWSVFNIWIPFLFDWIRHKNGFNVLGIKPSLNRSIIQHQSQGRVDSASIRIRLRHRRKTHVDFTAFHFFFFGNSTRGLFFSWSENCFAFIRLSIHLLNWHPNWQPNWNKVSFHVLYASHSYYSYARDTSLLNAWPKQVPSPSVCAQAS